MAQSLGSEKLRKRCKGRGAVRELQQKLKCASGMVSRWSRGEMKPSASWRFRLRDVLGIAPESWDKAPIQERAAS